MLSEERYQSLRGLAESWSLRALERAQNPETPPEELEQLVQDFAPRGTPFHRSRGGLAARVLDAVARNPSTPVRTLLLLTGVGYDYEVINNPVFVRELENPHTLLRYFGDGYFAYVEKLLNHPVGLKRFFHGIRKEVPAPNGEGIIYVLGIGWFAYAFFHPNGKPGPMQLCPTLDSLVRRITSYGSPLGISLDQLKHLVRSR